MLNNNVNNNSIANDNAVIVDEDYYFDLFKSLIQITIINKTYFDCIC